jgi:hypothetical protein
MHDHSSSNSRVVAAGSAGSGATSVSCDSGSVISFFEPTGDGLSEDAKGSGQPAQTAALVIGAQDALTLGVG